MQSHDLSLEAEERAEREAENTDEWRPAEGPGARLPAPEKFAHTGEYCVTGVCWVSDRVMVSSFRPEDRAFAQDIHQDHVDDTHSHNHHDVDLSACLLVRSLLQHPCELILNNPDYRGSLARTATHAPTLKAWVIDRDGGEIGQAVVQGLIATTQVRTFYFLARSRLID